jgi:uncharacterized protein with von Willebrand factor type A (vWA) domain
MGTANNKGFRVDGLELSLSYMDECPPAVLREVITFPDETPEAERVRGIRAWHDALLEGRLPTTDSWPPPHVAAPARKALEALGMARFLKGNEELVNDLLRDLMAAFRHGQERFQSEVIRYLEELAALERQRMEEQEREKKRKQMVKGEAPSNAPKKRDRLAPELTPKVLDALREKARQQALCQELDPDKGITAAWGEQARAWASIAEVFDDLGQILGRGHDFSLGILRHAGWKNLLRLHELVKGLPQLMQVVRTLGRMQAGGEKTSVAEEIFEPVKRLEEERRNVPMPHVPAETKGITRSGDIARMLPSEAALLGHPMLELLWHARRAEAALLTYQVQGTEVERILVERERMEARKQQRAKLERGPVVAVIDTSGSMHGLPEQVAKALVLAALRTAHAEKRRCYLFAFSGPGQLAEQELDLGPQGIGRLLDFLGFTFGGGTDIGAVESVVSHLEKPDWCKADVLIVSDGEFPVPSHVKKAVDAAREKGTRFHGLQIGNRGDTGLHELCDPVHVFTDWAAVMK